MSVLRAILVDADVEARAAVRRILAATQSVVVVGEFGTSDEVLLEGASRRPDLLIADIEYAPGGEERSARRIEALARAFPDAAICATGPDIPADVVLRVIRAGAVEFLRQPVERADVAAALDKISRFRRASAAAPRAGRIVSVFSTKGGLGVTTVATNVAVCLARQGAESVLLVDLDTRQSDVSTFLNVRGTYSVLDALENVDRLDESFLRGLLVRHASGVWVLPGPGRIERGQPGADKVQAALEIVRSHFDHVVLDLRHDLDPGTIAALECSDTIVFLTGLNVSALRSAAAGLAAFRHLGLNMHKLKVVVMREDTAEDVTLKHAREALGLPIAWKTPSDYPTAVACVNAGRPIVEAAPRSQLAKNLRQFAEAVTTGPVAASRRTAMRPASLLRLMWTSKSSAGA
jgi:pilus assembly protein CpaE